jgi:hypothetical protein
VQGGIETPKNFCAGILCWRHPTRVSFAYLLQIVFKTFSLKINTYLVRNACRFSYKVSLTFTFEHEVEHIHNFYYNFSTRMSNFVEIRSVVQALFVRTDGRTYLIGAPQGCELP